MKIFNVILVVAGLAITSSGFAEYRCIPIIDENCEQQNYSTKEEAKFTEDELLNQPFPQQTAELFVSTFDDYREVVSKEIKDVDEAKKKAMQQAVNALKLEAFKEAARELNKVLDKPLSQRELNERAEKASESHGQFLEEFKLIKQEFNKRGPFSNRPTEAILSGYFKINRSSLKEFLVDAVKSTELAFKEGEILSRTAPSPTEQTYIANYKDVVGEVIDTVSDEASAQKQTIQLLLGDLKKKALREAAMDVNHALAQPMDTAEFDRAIEKATRNFQDYISDWKITEQLLEETAYAGTRDKIRLGAWFAVDKDKLRRTLVEGRAITTVSKYRTYVEAFWNVPDKEINPDVLNTVIGNIEDHFSQQGYEVVEFERIKGDLVELLNKEPVADGSSASDDLFAMDELERFEANLDLRNIDSKFVNGKRILADYADLLIGVSITSMEVRDRMVRVRITLNATLFENGEWVDLAHHDGSASAPYVQGSTDSLIFVSKRIALDAAAQLEPKARKQIALRKTKEEIREHEEREFTLTFKNADKSLFYDIRRKLGEGKDWVYKGADFKDRAVRLGYRGQIDSLADGVDSFLGNFGLNSGIPEYARGQNRIFFGGGE